MLCFCRQVCVLANPWFFQHIVDTYAIQFNHYSTVQFFRGVGLWLLIAVMIVFAATLFKSFQDFITSVFSQSIGLELYSAVISHLLALPYAALEDMASGNVLSIVERFRAEVEKFLVVSINTSFSAVIGIVLVTLFAAQIHWSLAMAILFALPLVVVANLSLGKKARSLHQKIAQASALLKGATVESLRNIEIVKISGLVSEETQRLAATSHSIFEMELQKSRYLRQITLLQIMTSNIVHTAVLFFMLFLVYGRLISIGQYFSLFIYLFYVFGPLHELSTVVNLQREVRASLDEVKCIMSITPEVAKTGAIVLADITDLEFQNIWFSQSNGKFMLKGVNLEVSRGEVVAFVGPSGAGKTTLLKLIVGLYSPQAGDIRLNGISAQDIDLTAFRRKIGFVTQDSQLFSGTIRDNLLFVCPGSSDQECLEALRLAALEPMLQRSRYGLDTRIGEGGMSLSGGERQRLAIARALLRHPQILIFDEATSSLDPLTEEGIASTVRGLRDQSSLITILISHRLSTTMHADRIYVLNQGEIVERGSHSSLLGEGGLYTTLWTLQQGERATVEAQI
jgi:ATP-binding cassette subfamily B protein